MIQDVSQERFDGIAAEVQEELSRRIMLDACFAGSADKPKHRLTDPFLTVLVQWQLCFKTVMGAVDLVLLAGEVSLKDRGQGPQDRWQHHCEIHLQRLLLLKVSRDFLQEHQFGF